MELKKDQVWRLGKTDIYTRVISVGGSAVINERIVGQSGRKGNRISTFNSLFSYVGEHGKWCWRCNSACRRHESLELAHDCKKVLPN